MQAAAIDWHVYLLTHSPLALGLVGLSRVVPIATLSLWGGVAADRYDRRRIMLATQLTMAVVAATLAFLTLTGRETRWLLYVLTGLTSAAGSFDNPARQSLVPRLELSELRPSHEEDHVHGGHPTPHRVGGDHLPDDLPHDGRHEVGDAGHREGGERQQGAPR